MSADRETPRRRVGGVRRPNVIEIVLLKHGRPKGSICVYWERFEPGACVFGREKILALVVNADISRSTDSRSGIQERQIACQPVDRISAYGSGRPVFISGIQVRPRRIESKRRWTACGYSSRCYNRTYEPQDG